MTNLIAGKKTVYIKTCSEINYKPSVFFYFKPIQSIEQKIKAIEKSYFEKTIGLHIRRTDSKLSIELSPTSLFVDKINLELSENPETYFFLATDDLDVQTQLTKIYSGRIIIYNKEFSRKTVGATQDAVVDLFCLSKTSKIYGSFYSSFSKMAAKLSRSELEILKMPAIAKKGELVETSTAV